VFLRDSNLTFGGGTATTETLRRSLVGGRKWVSDAEFRFLYAASRLTPGTNLLALCTAIGWRLRGAPGALLALAAASIPSALAVSLLIAVFTDASSSPGVMSLARGAVAASIALILSGVWALVRPHAVSGRRWRALILIGLCWAGYDVLHLNAVAVLAAAGIVGAAWPER
jgi:chromate transporter